MRVTSDVELERGAMPTGRAAKEQLVVSMRRGRRQARQRINADKLARQTGADASTDRRRYCRRPGRWPLLRANTYSSPGRHFRAWNQGLGKTGDAELALRNAGMGIRWPLM